ncbi:MAG: TetR family transcriptional regulator [Bacteroidota bacterium]
METTIQNSKTLHLYRAKGLELFYKKGYFNTNLKEICASLSISEKAFIDTFISKEEFFISITQNLILQNILNLLIEPVTYKQSPFPLILDRMQIELEEAISNKNDNGFILANFISEFNTKNPRINRYLGDILKIWEINLISLLRKGQLDGYVKREVDCLGAANHVISSYMGVRTLMVEGNSRLLADQYIQQLRYYFYSISNSYGM